MSSPAGLCCDNALPLEVVEAGPSAVVQRPPIESLDHHRMLLADRARGVQLARLDPQAQTAALCFHADAGHAGPCDRLTKPPHATILSARVLQGAAGGMI